MLFEETHLSRVLGLVLRDGRRVVLKVRRAQDRLHGCVAVQRHLWRTGLPCPEPLAGPGPLVGRVGPSAAERLPGIAVHHWVASAEAYLPGGQLLPDACQHPARFATALALLVRLAPAPRAVPSLAPPPPWVGWAHDGAGVWPWPDDLDVDLNSVATPAWLDALGHRVRERLQRAENAGRFPRLIGHADWESQNLRWNVGAGDATLHAVHDWDSVVALPECMLAGAAAAVFPATGRPLTDATVEETAAFLDAYARARGAPWSVEERELAWSAGLWVRAFNAKKAAARGGGTAVVAAFAAEAQGRLARAGTFPGLPSFQRP